MTDRELLELAAKAAAIDGKWSDDFGKNGMLMLHKSTTYRVAFDPLNDDGDALRLAVKLGIGVSFTNDVLFDFRSVYVSDPDDGSVLAVGCITSSDELGVVRRAIVRAAAAIGKGMA